jgi:enoyl-CoA hydratase/carnithine racemase
LGLAGPATRLARFVGLGRAKDILLSGRALTAAEALQFGLVTAVAEEDVDAAALRIAQRLARTPLQGIRLTKRHIGDVYRVADTHEDELLAQSLELFRSDEVQAILRAASGPGGEEGGPARPR